MKKRQRRQQPKKTRRQQKLAKLIKNGELAHDEPVPGDVLRSLTLDEQYTCSVEDYKAEVRDRKSGLIPWHRLSPEIWQEAHDNKPYISKLVQNRAIRPSPETGKEGEERKELLRWIREAHPSGHRAPIPDALFRKETEPEPEPDTPTFLLNRDQTRVLFAHISVWEEVGSFLDRQRARFEIYWRDQTVEHFLDAFQGNFGLDDNTHTVHNTHEGDVYMAAYYLDRYQRYTVCIVLPIDIGEAGIGKTARVVGPPVYYCYTCLCG